MVLATYLNVPSKDQVPGRELFPVYRRNISTDRRTSMMVYGKVQQGKNVASGGSYK
jgi:hypothetical protein